MNYPVHIKIQLLNGNAELTIMSDKLKLMNGLPSGKPVVLDTGDREIPIKPYYRRFANGELTIFAVELLKEPTS